MKMILTSLALSLFCATQAMAMGPTPTYEIAYSTFSQQGVICTTGTVVDLVATYPSGIQGGRAAGYRVQNQDSADAVWLGDVDVSTHTGTIANLGEKLTAGSNGTYHLWKDKNAVRVGLYCIAADAAGAAGAVMSVLWFFY